MLILFYDTLWGQAFEPREAPPAGFVYTTDRQRYREANAVVFHLPAWSHWRYPRLFSWRRFLLPQKLPGQLWVAWSIECEENYPLLVDLGFMRKFDITMTYRLNADVPSTYFDYYSSAANLASTLRQPPQPKLSEPLVASFISSGINRSGRQQYAQELARWLSVDSYGKFMKNKSLVHDNWRPSKLETLARYKFTLAFENSCAQDYVTEKFFDPLIAGSVPVYLGAPNVEDFAPGEHCFINVTDFPTPKALAEYLISVASDEAAYRAYFAWKERPYRTTFQNLLAINAHHSFTRLCELLRSRLGCV